MQISSPIKNTPRERPVNTLLSIFFQILIYIHQRPKLSECCDVILANCYPYWEGCSLDYSLMYMKQMYNEALNAGNGKKVIVTETGWPSQGANLEGAFPSEENALKYFINLKF